MTRFSADCIGFMVLVFELCSGTVMNSITFLAVVGLRVSTSTVVVVAIYLHAGLAVKSSEPAGPPHSTASLNQAYSGWHT